MMARRLGIKVCCLKRLRVIGTAAACGGLLLTLCLPAQVIHQQLEPGHVPSNEEQLNKYGIGLSRKELIAALSHPKAEVRGLAASQLALNKDKDAIPDIKDAASVESSDVVRINMYFDLAELGERTAVGWLERVLAAHDLLLLKDKKCLPDVLSVAQSGSEEGDRAFALAIIPNFFLDGYEGLTDGVLAPICDRLWDQSGSVRLQAAIVLGQLGTSRQVVCLEKALSEEQDDTLRQTMEQSLKALRKRPVK
jgi:HEAT repeat protein